MFGRQSRETETVVRLLAEQVRRDISTGILEPDAKLKIDELRQRYGGSAHSFREALTQLSSEGLVEASAQRGFRVASATRTDLEDIARLRAEIEPLGLGWSVKHGDLAWEGTVLAAFHTYTRLCQQAVSDRAGMAIEWDEAGRHLHAALVAACRSPRLIDFQARLYIQSRRFRYAGLVEGRIDLNDETRDLRAVVDAAIARDAVSAQNALSQHILGALRH
ncbi:GntR family transcriptional regulator [Aliihoeflea sp. PC F10.4]